MCLSQYLGNFSLNLKFCTVSSSSRVCLCLLYSFNSSLINTHTSSTDQDDVNKNNASVFNTTQMPVQWWLKEFLLAFCLRLSRLSIFHSVQETAPVFGEWNCEFGLAVKFKIKIDSLEMQKFSSFQNFKFQKTVRSKTFVFFSKIKRNSINFFTHQRWPAIIYKALSKH